MYLQRRQTIGCCTIVCIISVREVYDAQCIMDTAELITHAISSPSKLRNLKLGIYNWAVIQIDKWVYDYIDSVKDTVVCHCCWYSDF